MHLHNNNDNNNNNTNNKGKALQYCLYPLKHGGHEFESHSRHACSSVMLPYVGSDLAAR
jgi:hypothetical protein